MLQCVKILFKIFSSKLKLPWVIRSILNYLSVAILFIGDFRSRDSFTHIRGHLGYSFF